MEMRLACGLLLVVAATVYSQSCDEGCFDDKGLCVPVDDTWKTLYMSQLCQVNQCVSPGVDYPVGYECYYADTDQCIADGDNIRVNEKCYDAYCDYKEETGYFHTSLKYYACPVKTDPDDEASITCRTESETFPHVIDGVQYNTCHCYLGEVDGMSTFGISCS